MAVQADMPGRRAEGEGSSDRVAVMRDGRIDQCATPQELYEEPATTFVANFLGAANLIPGDLAPGRRRRGARARLLPAALRAPRLPGGHGDRDDPSGVRAPRAARHRGREPRARDGRGGRLPRLP